MLFGHLVDEEDLAYIERIESDVRLLLFSGRLEVAPGIEIIEVGGRTPGQCVVRVSTRGGRTLIAIDAVHYFEEWSAMMLFGSGTDLVRMYESVDYIRGMMGNREIQRLVAGHDPVTVSRFARVSGRCEQVAATVGAVEV